MFALNGNFCVRCVRLYLLLRQQTPLRMQSTETDERTEWAWHGAHARRQRMNEIVLAAEKKRFFFLFDNFELKVQECEQQQKMINKIRTTTRRGKKNGNEPITVVIAVADANSKVQIHQYCTVKFNHLSGTELFYLIFFSLLSTLLLFIFLLIHYFLYACMHSNSRLGEPAHQRTLVYARNVSN